MLIWRLISAIGFLVPLVALLVVDFHFAANTPGIWLLPVLLSVVILAAGEFVELISPPEHQPNRWLVQLCVAFVILSSAAPMAWSLVGSTYPADCPLGRLGWPLGATALAVVCLMVAEMVRFERPGNHVLRLAMGSYGVIYLGLFLSFLYPLRSLNGNAWGMAAVVSLLLVVKMSDVGAYTVGRLFGRTKLVPKLSPGKTVEGAVGGIVTAMLVSWVFFTWVVPQMVAAASPLDVWRSVLYGAVLACAAIVGDLAESLLKRDMNRKDSSQWLRGLGGILDLLDSLIVTAPTAYLCWAAGLVGPDKV